MRESQPPPLVVIEARPVGALEIAGSETPLRVHRQTLPLRTGPGEGDRAAMAAGNPATVRSMGAPCPGFSFLLRS
ncbi:MAG: hypothetical protein AB7I33_04190 [Gemmatimonadales bacterium]